MSLLSPSNLLAKLPFGGKGGDRRPPPSALRRKLRRGQHLSPPQLLVLSFLGLVAFGTLGLRWIPGLYTGLPLSWLNCLFTATSAVCVTGLIVVDTAVYFTFWGQLFILLLIQLGGLGMIGLASAIIVTFNRRLSLRQHAIAGGGDATGPAANVPLKFLVRDVLVFTLLSELGGFVLLWALWAFDPPDENMHAHAVAWHALFHSISAFCNAGFSTFSDSLVGFQNRPWTQLVIMGGIVVGGIGFLTLEEIKLWLFARKRERGFRLSLHSRLVLVSTLAIILLGWAALTALEWNNPQTLRNMSVFDKLVNGLFLSVTPRTAGFNTVDYGYTLPATKFVTVLLMSVGGAPGGTAGGMKVTTVALLAMMAYSRFRARRTTDLWGRTIPPTTAQRAVGLFSFAFVIVTAGILLLTVSELGSAYATTKELGLEPTNPFDFLDYMFEASSAFNTVGLSTGPTASLSAPARVLVVILMFVGRVGPLTFAAALSRSSPEQRLIKRFAQEDVVVG